jgi:4'-phosphopantetheinyl transferase
MIEGLIVDVRYRRTSSLSDKAIGDAERYLSVEEIQRRNRLHRAVDRRDFAIAHDLLRRTLSDHSDLNPAAWKFRRSPYGKPFIDNSSLDTSSLSFSLSHTTGFVACAVTTADQVGIDVERADRIMSPLEIATQLFSEYEVSQLREYPKREQSTHFAELWALKEAYLKAVGVGLSGSLSQPTFRFVEPRSILVRALPEARNLSWDFTLFDIGENARLAVAVRGEQPRVSIKTEDCGVQFPNVLRTSAG